MNAIETKVLELIGEDTSSPDVFVDTDTGMAPIRDSINDAIQEIALVSGSRREKYYLPLRQDQMFYRFALNDGYMGWIVGCWSLNQKYRLEQTDMMKLSHYDPRWMVPTGEPRSYFQIGLDVIGFWPKPSADSNVIEMDMVVIPESYTDAADRIMLRSDFQYAATHYAVSEYWASRGDASSAAEHFRIYLDTLGLRSLQGDSSEQSYRLSVNKDPWPKETG